MLTAALDAARLGARAPLSADLLRAAAVDYCTSAQQAEAPGNWFEQALAYANKKLHGAAAALSPAAAGMGQVAGYTAADYLIQHATRERRYVRVPASTWDALIGHVRDPADAARLAYSAENRLLYRCAIPLYRHAADAGDGNATLWLARLLAERGDLDELRARADAGDGNAALELARLVASGAARRLRGRADADDWHGLWGPPDLLAKRADFDEAIQILRAEADAGNQDAALQLAGLLVQRGDLDEATQILRARADAGNQDAALQLAGLLVQRGNFDELRARAEARDLAAMSSLDMLLFQRADLDELRARADISNGWVGVAALELAERLFQRGDLDELRARADAGDWNAARKLADLLFERGDLDGLRARAEADDQHAAEKLADLLVQRGDLDELRARAEAGDRGAVSRLPDLLIKQGRGEEAERLRRFGLNLDGSIACA